MDGLSSNSQNLFCSGSPGLGLLMSIINSIIHWSVGQLGVPVDFGDAGSAAFFAIIGMPISIALSILGGMLGSLFYRIVFQRKNIKNVP
jgi:hypothetical protein